MYPLAIDHNYKILERKVCLGQAEEVRLHSQASSFYYFSEGFIFSVLCSNLAVYFLLCISYQNILLLISVGGRTFA